VSGPEYRVCMYNQIICCCIAARGGGPDGGEGGCPRGDVLPQHFHDNRPSAAYKAPSPIPPYPPTRSLTRTRMSPPWAASVPGQTRTSLGSSRGNSTRDSSPICPLSSPPPPPPPPPSPPHPPPTPRVRYPSSWSDPCHHSHHTHHQGNGGAIPPSRSDPHHLSVFALPDATASLYSTQSPGVDD
jgi:hypothetical protein